MASNRLATAAIVLVGGASSRMGADKATLVVDGEAMVDHAQRVVRACGVGQIAIAGTANVPDAGEQGKRQGPMAGIVGGWRYLRTAVPVAETIVVLACDLPAVTEDVIRSLLAASQTAEHGAVAHDGQYPQPLIAAYSSLALDLIEQAFDRGERSVRTCFADWHLAEVAFSPEVLADADYPDDLAGFQVDWPS